MKNFLISGSVLVALLLPLSGCPAGSTIFLGVWLFSMDSNTPYIGAAFLPDGEMDEFDSNSRPVGSDGTYSGILTWQQDGNEITILQDGVSFDRLFTATLEGRTYMTGTWMNFNGSNLSGTFVASKAPSN